MASRSQPIFHGRMSGERRGSLPFLFGVFGAAPQRERVAVLFHNLAKDDRETALERQRPPAQVASDPAPEPSRAKPATLRPTDYGVYAISNDSLIELQLLPGRPPDIRVA